MSISRSFRFFVALVFIWPIAAETKAGHPFLGITYIVRTEALPRAETMHIVEIDLSAPGVHFELTPQGGPRETVRQQTLEFLRQEHAQVAVNAHFFLPYPSADTNAYLVGLAASDGEVFSAFEKPEQSYAIVADAPALNIDAGNHASIVHRDAKFVDGKHVIENVTLWTAVSGSAQIVTDGVKTIPKYGVELTPGGPGSYSSTNSWYGRLAARTAIGLTGDARTLVIFTVDAAGGSRGMPVGEVADLLIRDYGVYNALNLDGGGSTSLAIGDKLVNASSDNAQGRAVGSTLAIFASPIGVEQR